MENISNRPRFVPTSDDPDFSSLVGYIECSYAALVAAFGEPNGNSDEYKVSTEWIIKDAQGGKSFIVYDWKETDMYESDLPTVEEFRALPSYKWHIGADDAIDFFALNNFISHCKL